MLLSGHLREVRNRVVKMALALIAGMAAGFVFFNPVWHFIERPLCSATIRGYQGCGKLGVNQLVLNGPLDAFCLRVKVALIAGILPSCPVWLYRVNLAGILTRQRSRKWRRMMIFGIFPIAGVANPGVRPVHPQAAGTHGGGKDPEGIIASLAERTG
jgi:Sec-independent protein secretion pathway component TatC